MNESGRPRALHLQSGDEAVFATFHPAACPRTGAVRNGVVICPPHGWEELASHRVLRTWAERFAASGADVLRPDLPGTGDSSGSPRDPDRLRSWVGAVRDCAAWLRDAGGCDRVAVLGLGLGAMVACLAGAEPSAIDDLVLWGAPARGRSFVRELVAFASLNADDPDLTGNDDDGSVEAGGFVLGAETVRDLEALDLRQRDLGGDASRRVLLLDRDGIAPDQKLVASLEAGGAQVSVAPGSGYGAMTGHPQQAVVPAATIDSVVAWVAGAPGPSATGAPPAPAELPAATIEVDGARITEMAFPVSQPFGAIEGVLALPEGEEDEPGLVGILLNAGAVRRVGPGRQWVEIARSWTARGVPTLRLDLEGIGDADGERDYRDDGALYVPRMVEQVLAAMDAVSGQVRGTPRFVLMGLCSGGYWGFHAGLRDERVAALMLLNPRALFFEESLAVERDARKMAELTRAAGWKRVGPHSLAPSRLLRLLRFVLVAPVRWPISRRRRRKRRQEVAEAFTTLRDRAVRVLMVFGHEEPLYEELEIDGHLAGLEEWPNMELQVVPGRDHTFRPLPTQRLVHEIVGRELRDQLGEGVVVEPVRRAT